ncbi:uncharacterized protein LOC141617008 [Silene latifolia]|uniref:uncharacterized protein LOC141617008 n=1 Tax=Silene latifolia TaxID=37657 RepID=UPI003D784E4C
MTIQKNSQNRFSPLSSVTKNTKNSNKASSSATASSIVIPGGPVEAVANKTRMVSEIVGVAPYDLDSLVPENHGAWTQVGKGKSPLEPIVEEPSDLIQFTKADVKDEIAYWKNSVYCFVLGANPPLKVLDGFIRRIWINHDFDKVSFLPNGIFMVRFKSERTKNVVLQQGHYLFDNKPLIVRPWSESVVLVKDDVKEVPVSDTATVDKTMLGFARVMVDVPFGLRIPENVKFLDEDGQVVSIPVEFEWKPILCKQCGGIGHETATCRKPKPKGKPVIDKQQWRPKTIQKKQTGPSVVPAGQAPVADEKECVLAPNLSKLSQYTFLDALNNATPKVGIGTKGSGLPPRRVMHNIGFWNFRGLNSPTKQNTIKWFLHHYHVGLFGLLETKVKPLSLNSFIHMKAKEIGSGDGFYITMVYAFNEVENRRMLWNRLCGFKKKTRGSTSEQEMEDFQNCIDECELVDSPAIGSLFTWNNKQDPSTRIYSRLDRVLVNQSWLRRFQDSYAHFYTKGLMDHTPCIIQTSENTPVKRRSFKYFHMWSKSEQFHACVKDIWDQKWYGTKMFILVKKLKSLKQPLKPLNRAQFDDIENNTVRAWQHLEYIQGKLRSDPLNVDLIQQEINAAKCYRELNDACYAFLTQKSKVTWVDKGDNNTKYFHSVLKSRQARNKVVKIADRNGVACETTGQIQQAFLDFYMNLLGTAKDTSPGSVSIVQQGPICSPAHTEMLLAPVTNEEIKKIMFSIPIHKYVGPYGFSSAFFRDAWDVVGGEVCEAVQDFFHNEKLLKQLNHTLISLIPKCERPQNVTQLRPISCCNVVYKCISKLLCSRLATVLPCIISPNQGGFIKGRSIVENILICQDVIRLYNRKAISPRFMLKVDLKKAYDSISWSFLEQMMRALQFPGEFIALVMECVCTASYSLVMNGEIFGFFKGQKGLRQGDPLSPLLFTITMEYLSRVMHYITEIVPFKYHPICSKMKLSHLMFADDLLLFSKGDAASIMVMLRVFATFSQASGLQMNNNKTNAYFNGVQGQLPFSYLGVPITDGRLQKKDCQVLIEKLVSRIRGFGARHLSYAGRLVNYLWDGKVDFIRVPLVGWEKVCAPKNEGELGIRDSYAWNVAAVGKLVGWVFSKPDSLWVRWVHHVYVKDAAWPNYIPKYDVSWSWKAIVKVRDKLLGYYSANLWQEESRGYSVSSGYEVMRRTFQRVAWHKQVWNGWCLPKHQFIGWLIAREALQTKDKLYKLGCCSDSLCLLCGNIDESDSHLFQDCVYSLRILEGIAQLCNVQLPAMNVVSWVYTRPFTKLQKGVIGSAFMAAHYAIWMQRNKVRVDSCLMKPEMVITQVQNQYKMRVLAKMSKEMQIRDSNWLSSLPLMR